MSETAPSRGLPPSEIRDPKEVEDIVKRREKLYELSISDIEQILANPDATFFESKLTTYLP